MSKRIGFAVMAVAVHSTLLTGFFYVHESLPKPLRAVTSLLGAPVAIASGISHYGHLGIPVYQTPWAVFLANLVFSCFAVAFVAWRFRKRT